MAARPGAPTHVANVFQSGPNTISQLLEHPPQLREYGWDLRTADRARIVNGEFLELTNGPYKKLRLYEDGTLFFRAAIDPDFLAWETEESEIEKAIRLNTLAAIEVTTVFTLLYSKIISHLSPAVPEIVFHLQIANAPVGSRYLYVTPWPLHSVGWQLNEKRRRIAQPVNDKSLTVSTDAITNDPHRVAFSLVEKLFLFFSVPPNEIPYVSEEGGVRRIDVNSFSKL